MKTLRAVVVGLRHPHMGTFGPETPGYIHTINELEGLEVVAYCEDSDPRLLDEARRYDQRARTYDNVADVIDKEDFDIAFVALPAAEVPRAVIALAEAGKHLFMEKQFARKASDLAEVVRAVRRNGVKVLPGYPWRFHPIAQDLKRLIEGGLLGKPLSVETRLVQRQVLQVQSERMFFTDKDEGGGVLHMLGCHYVDLMRFFMGCEVKAVQAMTARPVGYIDEPLEDVAVAAFEFENGALGSIHTGYLLPRPEEVPAPEGGYDSSFVYRGADGWADWNPTGAHKSTVRSASPKWRGAPVRTFSYELTPFTGYGPRWIFDWLQRFVRDVQAGREPELAVEDALHVLRCIEAAYESSRTGRRVEVRYGA